MKLKKIYLSINYAIIIALTALFIVIIISYKLQSKIDSHREIRFKSYSIAEELRQTSEDLTKYCRTYVMTGDDVWEQKYWDVLDIRNGLKPRPDGRTIALRDSMKNLGFTDEEFVKLKEAEDNSNRLVNTEKVAFNAMKGIFADSLGNFTVIEKPDTALARRVLFDKVYHADKKSIMDPIDDFISLIKERTKSVDESNYRKSKDLLTLTLVISVLISLLSVFSFSSILKSIVKRIDDLKKYKRAVDESEEKFKTIFETSQDSIVISKNGIILFFNDAFVKLLGYEKPDEIVGGSILKHISINEREKVKINIEKRKKGEKISGLYESVGIRKDGTEFPFEVSSDSYEINNEKYTVAIVRDISERKQAEQALKESNAKFSIAFYKSTVAKTLTSFPEGVFIDANDEFMKLAGYSGEELIGSSSEELNIWADLSERKEFVDSINRDGMLKNKEFIFKNKSGHFRNCLLSSSVLTVSNKKYILSNVIDITEQKEMQEKIKIAEERCAHALEATGQAVWDWDMITNNLLVSKIWKKNLGFGDCEIGRTLEVWKTKIHPDDLSYVMADINKHIQNQTEYYESIYRLQRKDKSYITVLDKGKIFEWTSDNKPSRMVGAFIDITRQKEAELQLKKLNATKDKFFSIIAHDLRGPLGSMVQISELLAEKGEMTEEDLYDILRSQRELSQNTFQLVENLLYWARHNSEQIKFDPKKILLNTIIDENIISVEFSAKQKDISVFTNYVDKFEVFADENMVRLIIRNLLTNALKFTAPQGKITINLEDKGDYIETKITDTGIGISKENILKILSDDEFYSTSGTLSEKGTGLGLKLCKSFITRNNGELNIISELNKGTSFLFTLPKFDS